jgi:hypothetical protein
MRDLPDLADRDQLPEPWRRGGQVAEDPGAVEKVAHRPDLELEQHVLAHRFVRVDRDRPEVLRHLDLVEADLGVMEDAREALLGRDLADDRPLAGGGGGEADRERDRRLADAALAGDDDQPLVEQLCRRGIIPTRRPGSSGAATPADLFLVQETPKLVRITAIKWDFSIADRATTETGLVPRRPTGPGRSTATK